MSQNVRSSTDPRFRNGDASSVHDRRPPPETHQAAASEPPLVVVSRPWTIRKWLAVLLAAIAIVGLAMVARRAQLDITASGPIDRMARRSASLEVADLIKAGMYQQAHYQLSTQVIDDAANADLHFLLGVCELREQRLSSSNQHFERAIRLNPDLGELAGECYLTAGTDADAAAMMSCYKYAAQLSPSLRPQIAAEWLNQTNASLKEGLLDEACWQAEEAIANNAQLKPEVAKAFAAVVEQSIAAENLAEAHKCADVAVGYDSDIAGQLADSFASYTARAIDGRDMHRAIDAATLAVQYDASAAPAVARTLADATVLFLKEDLLAAQLLAEEAIRHDSTQGRALAEAFAEKLTVQIQAGNFEQVADMVEVVIGYDRAVAPQLAEAILERARRGSAVEATRLVTATCEVHAESRDEGIALLFDRAEQALHGSTQDTGDAFAMLDAAVALDSAARIRAATLVWDALTPRLVNPNGFTRSEFLSLVEQCSRYGLPDGATQSPEHLLMMAIKYYDNGPRQQGIRKFQELIARFPDSSCAAVAKSILASPKPCRIEFTSQPLVFKGGVTLRGYSRRRDITINLVEAVITAEQIRLSLSLKAGLDECGLIYAPRDAKEEYVKVLGIYAMDNCGVRHNPLEGFVGGVQRAYLSYDYVNAIVLNPREEVIVSVIFPMMSPGATALDFYVPDVSSSSDTGWKFMDIRLKTGLFGEEVKGHVSQGPPLVRQAAAREEVQPGLVGVNAAPLQQPIQPGLLAGQWQAEDNGGQLIIRDAGNRLTISVANNAVFREFGGTLTKHGDPQRPEYRGVITYVYANDRDRRKHRADYRISIIDNDRLRVIFTPPGGNRREEFTKWSRGG